MGQTGSVATRLWGVVIGALDPVAQARWWANALGWSWEVDEDGDGRVFSGDPDVPQLLFEQVGDAKTPVKNRLHLDFTPDDQQAEVDRLIGMGARHVDVGQGEQTWVVLADPEGNEFCVLAAAEN